MDSLNCKVLKEHSLLQPLAVLTIVFKPMLKTLQTCEAAKLPLILLKDGSPDAPMGRILPEESRPGD